MWRQLAVSTVALMQGKRLYKVINSCVLNVSSYLNVSGHENCSIIPRLGNVARTIALFSCTNPG